MDFSTIEIAGRSFRIDSRGFIQDFERWDVEVARALARDDGLLDISQDHWRVLFFIREYYNAFGLAPSIRRVSVTSGIEAARLYELFPKGPAMGACRIAGLPSPDGCL